MIDAFSSALLGLPVAHVWQGYGSALFVEFGVLSPTKDSVQGSSGALRGELTLMIEWSWRIERPRSILCGSFSEESKWPAAFRQLLGAEVIGLELLGRLPEIAISLSNSLGIVSFSTSEGQPRWALFDNRTPEPSWLKVKGAKVVREGL